jgi:hypothetical protein
MGVTIGEWSFVTAAPAIGTIAEALARATGLEVRQEGERDDVALLLPTLGERLFDWRCEGTSVTVHGFIPAHPYLWEALDTVMTSLGGRIGDEAHLWQPDPAHAGLRRPWGELTAAQRAILRVPTVGAWRPLDRLL